MSKKIVFLLLALILPVLVFLFLKFYGKNEFTVEPLFQTGEVKLPAGCSTIQVPYIIPDSTYFYLKREYETDSLLVIFYEGMTKDLDASDTQLRRLNESFRPGTRVSVKRMSGIDKWVECALILHSPKDVVLLDNKRRIRGQYISEDRDDIDRLMMELDIILKRY
ncbi:MAG: hypothetical protein AABY93_15925 [Bacteroidota bacterium]